VSATLDVLAIAAHRDDVEQTCGGTLLKMAKKGARCGILDLTQGEMGTRGTADSRAKEAAEAAQILRVAWRDALDLPDGRVENSYLNRIKIARVVREQRPLVVILPYWQGRHPDHYTCSILGYEACFLAGLKRLGETDATADIPTDLLDALKALPPHRPFKIVYASLYANVQPAFVVDVSEEFETRLQSLMAYSSQYQDQDAGSGLFPKRAAIRDNITAMATFYGLLAGVKYAEPYVQKEVGLVEDLRYLPVQSL
jgi:bacillithiol biosynthesis deacetylase BshB1